MTNVSIDKLVAMETFLPWQQVNYTITVLCESILSSNFSLIFLGTKHITGVTGCYGSTVTMATKDCSITQQHARILSSCLMHNVPRDKMYH